MTPIESYPWRRIDWWQANGWFLPVLDLNQLEICNRQLSLAHRVLLHYFFDLLSGTNFCNYDATGSGFFGSWGNENSFFIIPVKKFSISFHKSIDDLYRLFVHWTDYEHLLSPCLDISGAQCQADPDHADTSESKLIYRPRLLSGAMPFLNRPSGHSPTLLPREWSQRLSSCPPQPTLRGFQMDVYRFLC